MLGNGSYYSNLSVLATRSIVPEEGLLLGTSTALETPPPPKDVVIVVGMRACSQSSLL